MTVSSPVSTHASYTGSGITGPYAIPNVPYTYADSEVKVRIDNVEQTLTTHYTIASNQVTFVSAPASGTLIEIEVWIPFTQPTDFTTDGILPAETIESRLDDLTGFTHQLLTRTGGTDYDLSGTNMRIGSYAGDGTSSQSIESVGWQPDIVLITKAGVNTVLMALAAEDAGNPVDVKDLSGANAVLTNGLSVDAAGFNVLSSSTLINESAATYYYIAIKQSK